MIGKIKLDDKGLVPAVAQNAETKEVIMLGYMSVGAVKRTLEAATSGFTAGGVLIFGIRVKFLVTICM